MVTDGDATVRSYEVDVRLRDGSHTNLIIGSGEECGECAGKCNHTVTGGTADGHAHLQLLTVPLVSPN